MFINILMIVSVLIDTIALSQENPTSTAAAENVNSTEHDNRFSTCLDIQKKNSSAVDGFYRIDPKSKYENGDNATDFQVWCDFYANETCVYPQILDSTILKPSDMSTAPGEVWIANIGKEIYYPFDNSQIRILQETSRWCHQNITVHCKNIVAFYDDALNTFDKSVKILSWNDIELTPLGPLALRLRGVKDDCQYMDDPNEWKETVIEYITDKCERLPFTDVAIRDVWRGHGHGPGQWFYVEVGPVCFSWNHIDKSIV